MTYNEILNYIEQQDDDGTKVWQFHCITAHEGPLKPSDPTYKGSKYNVMIEWENGEMSGMLSIKRLLHGGSCAKPDS